MTTNTGNGDLERYLLGLLPDDERDRIDGRLLVDSQLFDAICIVEHELAYDYALGLLTPDERHRFEERFLHRPEVQVRVRTAAALIGGLRGAEPVSPSYRWWLYAAAAAASLFLVAWLVRDEARLRAPESRLASAPATQPASTPAPASPAPPPAPSEPSNTTASIVAVVLQPGVVRSTAAPSRIRLRPGEIARIELTLPPATAPAASYRASIRNPDDLQMWEGTGVVSKDGRAITLTVPAASLPRNDYEVTLYAVRPGRSPEEIASYALSTTSQ